MFCLFFLQKEAHLQSNAQDFDAFVDEFIREYEQLSIAPLSISYFTNLNQIPSLDTVLIQEDFFLNTKIELSKFKMETFNEQEKIDYQLIEYETKLRLLGLQLEKKWHNIEIDSIHQSGLRDVPLGKEWYVYFLKKWVDLEVEPEEMFLFGLNEIHKVKSQMEAIQIKSKLSKNDFEIFLLGQNFYINNVAEVQQSFEELQVEIWKIIPLYFPYLDQLSKAKITRGRSSRLAKVPAYYRSVDSTFYYNYFNQAFCNRQCTWIFVHEASPGHHYQIAINNSLKESKIKHLFSYYGFSEGYAAYVEEVGIELGFYKDAYQEYGKWEWDLIRSLRVALDVGINYYAWDDETAMAFWKLHISGQDDIGEREINRMKNWPAQVITYKYGADKFLKWKNKAQEKANFNFKSFHTEILKRGSLPFSVLEQYLSE